MKKTNRRTLRNAAAKGRLYVKCSFSLTDDYAFDAANNNGKMQYFVQARIKTECPEARKIRDAVDQYYAEHKGQPCSVSHAAVEPMLEQARELEREHRDREYREHPNVVWFNESDFRTKSGHIHGDKHSGNFSVHSNLNYEYMIADDEPVMLESC